MQKTKHSRMPTVVAIHDLCGYGNCSLKLVLPILMAAQIEVLAAPTAVLSAHTAVPEAVLHDLSELLPHVFVHWETRGLPIDGAYSGFLGSQEQIVQIRSFFESRPEMTVVLDPVMADHGKVYRSYTPEMCAGMKSLLPYADLLTPNLSELAILLDQPYEGADVTAAKAEESMDRLLAMGAKNVVLKGLRRGDGLIRNALKGEGLPYQECSHPWRDLHMHGTGDLFASLMTAAIFKQRSLPEAMALAGEWTGLAIDASQAFPAHGERGVNVEPILAEWARLFQP